MEKLGFGSWISSKHQSLTFNIIVKLFELWKDDKIGPQNFYLNQIGLLRF